MVFEVQTFENEIVSKCNLVFIFVKKLDINHVKSFLY